MNQCEIVSCIDANVLLVSLGCVCVCVCIAAHASGRLLAGLWYPTGTDPAQAAWWKGQAVACMYTHTHHTYRHTH